jgi:hypothetical protein
VSNFVWAADIYQCCWYISIIDSFLYLWFIYISLQLLFWIVFLSYIIIWLGNNFLGDICFDTWAIISHKNHIHQTESSIPPCLAAYTEDTECVGLARLGSEDQIIVAGTMKQLQLIDFGAPLHCLVITGKTHPLEEEMLDFYRCKP